MWQRIRTRRFWEPMTRALFLLASGAYLFASYLSIRWPDAKFLDAEYDGIRLAWIVFWLAWLITAPRRIEIAKNSSPAFSGTAVVVACGLGAAIFLGRDVASSKDFATPAIVILVTAIIAVIVYRFATKYASEIGEARFPTANGESDR